MKDFIIVGQGLAGTVLALTLKQRGCSVQVIDNEHSGISSRVAAGIFNPVTGRKMVKTWKAEKLFPFLNMFYQSAEKLLDNRFLYKRKIFRPFTSVGQQNDWLSNAGGDMKQFIGSISEPGAYASDVRDEYGGIETDMSGFVDLPKFLDAAKSFFQQEGDYSADTFDYAQVRFEGESLSYKEHSARKIIFCEGAAVKDNPFFNWLPVVPNKGEILNIKVSELGTDSILNKNVFIVPREDSAVTGSTYAREFDSSEPTEAGKDDITRRLEQFLKKDYVVTGQKAGLRPTVPDRRPLVGLHPENNKLGVFNGMGTKGVSLAPYFADHFASHLLNSEPLNKEVNILRYFSLDMSSGEKP